MKKVGSLIRTVLFRSLSFENYLLVLSKLYFFSFNTGILKKNKSFEYPYFLKNLIAPGDVIIDIGANLGYLTVLFAKLTGNGGHVHAVEPVAPVRKILSKNTKGFTNVSIYPVALGNENKKIQLGNNTRIKQGYIGSGSHFVVDQKKTNADTDIVSDAEMKKGSELFNQLTRIDFIKCDIEGFETVVLPEMDKLIQRFKPTLLVETGGENRKKMLNFFQDRNFQAYILLDGKFFSTNEKESRDIFFIHESHLEKVSKYLGD